MVNAVSDAARSAVSPNAAPAPQTNKPLQMPSPAVTPARGPPEVELRRTIAVSAPGATVRTPAAATKARSEIKMELSMGQIIRTDIRQIPAFWRPRIAFLTGPGKGKSCPPAAYRGTRPKHDGHLAGTRPHQRAVQRGPRSRLQDHGRRGDIWRDRAARRQGAHR